MNIFESINTAISNVLANKMRTFLTMIGIIIGVASVITITSLGNGFKATIEKTFSMLNKNALQIYPMTDNFTYDDLEFLRKNRNVRYAARVDNTQFGIEYKIEKKEKKVMAIGSDPEFSKIEKNYFDMAYGRVYNKRDNEAKSRVCIINKKLAKDVFGRENALGQEINVFIMDWKNNSIQEKTFKIIGISNMTDIMMNQPVIMIPINTLTELTKEEGSDQIYLETNNINSMKQAKAEINRAMSAKYKISYDELYITSNLEISKSIEKVIGMFTMFLSFVAGMALLVGGIGVMNIMLVTVTERTREIGIKMAIGATKKEIKMQFLIEAVFICLLGGVIGIAVGYFAGIIFAEILSTPIEIRMGTKFVRPFMSYNSMMISAICSVAVGIIFGVYPASKAANLDPIQALRHE